MKPSPALLPASLLPPIALLLGACTDQAIFVTSTDIGIQANANTQQAHIGYGRTELFQGPASPSTGAVPQVVGYLGSNLEIFSPKIIQVYATGDAADLVTQQAPSAATAADPEKLSGATQPMVFATESNIGLKLGFTSALPTSIKFGYDRQELSIIPLHPDPASKDGAKYASVLATMNMDLATPTTGQSGAGQPASGLPATNLAVTQFFATGSAAKNLAKNPLIQSYMQGIGENGVKAAEVASSQALIDANAHALASNNAAVQQFFKSCSPYATAQSQMIAQLKPTGLLGNDARTALTNAKDPPAFVAALNQNNLEKAAAQKAPGAPCTPAS
jgi:hypothetical protein